MSKNVAETEEPQMTTQYGAYALHAGLARLCARMRMHTPTPPGTHVHARTHKHAHTYQYVILIAFPLQQWFRESVSVLRHKYIDFLVGFCMQATQKYFQDYHSPRCRMTRVKTGRTRLRSTTFPVKSGGKDSIATFSFSGALASMGIHGNLKLC